MSNTSNLAARVEALEKAVQSLLSAVKILETIHEDGLKVPSKKAGKSSEKKHAPVKKRAAKS
jgi:hypothetical protein